ncbi:MAG: RidA family protein [Nevskiaceae bacterium]
MSRKPVHTDEAPGAIGTYSQAVACGKTVYLSGQIPLDPKTMTLVAGGIEEQIHQMFRNLAAVARAAGGSLAHASKVTIYMTDLTQFAKVNEIMAQYFTQPYPARATVGVAALPKGAAVEADAVLVLD